MLITKTKVINLHGQRIKVYSLDNGRTWFSKPSDLAKYRRRRAAELYWLRRRFAAKSALPTATVDFDYWGR